MQSILAYSVSIYLQENEIYQKSYIKNINFEKKYKVIVNRYLDLLDEKKH